MNVLAELHQEPGLKLNLKFEIEVLCKTLNLDIAAVSVKIVVFGKIGKDCEQLITQKVTAE